MLITISESEIRQTPNESDLGRLVKEKWMETKSRIENDVCVQCGLVSPYKKTDHIAWRIGYVEGAGQACFQPKKCNMS